MLRFVLVALAFVFLSPVIADAQTGSGRGSVITVRGDGRADLSPEHARLSADLVTRGATIEPVVAAHRDSSAKALAALRSMSKFGIEIERSGFRLDRVPIGKAPNDESAMEYRAVTSFELKAKRIEQIDAAISAIAASGFFELRNLRFGIDDRSPALNIARKNAVADARERATVYAQAAGVTLGEILEITDDAPRMLRETAADMPEMRQMAVIPPENIGLNASVSITWRIKP